MKVGPLELQRPQNALECLLAPSGVAGHLTALAASVGCVVVGMIGIEPLLDRAPGELQHLTAHSHFQGSEIELGHALPSQECIDIP